MRLSEACALAQEIQFNERAPWRVNKIEQFGPFTFCVNVSVMGQPTAGWWFSSREEWLAVLDSVTASETKGGTAE